MNLKPIGKRILRSLAWLWLMSAPLALAKLSATIDRNQITELDLVTLTVRQDDSLTSASPNFADIDADFNIVGKSGPNQSSRITLARGQQVAETYTEWSLTLRAKRLGRLTIPAITLGTETTPPIPVEVLQASTATVAHMNQFVFFETSVDTQDTYVQGQVLYTVKLYYVDGLSGDFPPPPAISEAVVESVESERRYEAIVTNRRFNVLEKQYAIYPQKSGTLVIPRETFVGSRGRRSFFGTGEQVSAVSRQFTVDVKPRPAAFTGANWLPARQVNLTESWSQTSPHFRVGEPVNRTLVLTAEGVATSLIPPFTDMPLANAKSYLEPPVTTSEASDHGIRTTMKTNIGIVPTQEGPMALPEIRIPWWNTITDRMEVAVLPARTIQVEPSTAALVRVPVAPAPLMPTTPVIDNVGQTIGNGPWPYIALAIALLWLMTLWLWWSTRRQLTTIRSGPAPEPLLAPADEAASLRLLRDACRANHASKARSALVAWVRARHPDIHSLAEFAQRVDDDDIHRQIAAMENALYARDGQQPWEGAALFASIEALHIRKPERPKRNALVSALNPV